MRYTNNEVGTDDQENEYTCICRHLSITNYNELSENLEFLYFSQINFEGKTATGVSFIRGGLKFTANVAKEVIVSAGAIGSPQLLMLSGVGPKAELSELKVRIM